jgi:hypothetical protein
MGFLHDKADADDLTQDIFIQDYQSLPRFKGDRKSSNNCSAESLQAMAEVWDQDKAGEPDRVVKTLSTPIKTGYVTCMKSHRGNNTCLP